MFLWRTGEIIAELSSNAPPLFLIFFTVAIYVHVNKINIDLIVCEIFVPQKKKLYLLSYDPVKTLISMSIPISRVERKTVVTQTYF